jgi:hypothetical protein
VITDKTHGVKVRGQIILTPVSSHRYDGLPWPWPHLPSTTLRLWLTPPGAEVGRLSPALYPGTALRSKPGDRRWSPPVLYDPAGPDLHFSVYTVYDTPVEILVEQPPWY